MIPIFESIFTWATIPMDYIDNGVTVLCDYIFTIMSDGWIRDLIVNGIVAGIGGIATMEYK